MANVPACPPVDGGKGLKNPEKTLRIPSLPGFSFGRKMLL